MKIDTGQRLTCSNCCCWQRITLDYGHCWSGERMDDIKDGPADLTYPDAFCEGHQAGTFDPAALIEMGGDPSQDYQGAAADM